MLQGNIPETVKIPGLVKKLPNFFRPFNGH